MNNAPKFDPISVLAEIIKKSTSITTTTSVAAKVDGAELILKSTSEGGYEEERKIADAFLVEVANGKNSDADTTTRIRALKALINLGGWE